MCVCVWVWVCLRRLAYIEDPKAAQFSFTQAMCAVVHTVTIPSVKLQLSRSQQGLLSSSVLRRLEYK